MWFKLLSFGESTCFTSSISVGCAYGNSDNTIPFQQTTYNNYFTFGFQIAGFLVLLLMMKYQHMFSLNVRIALPMAFQLVVFTLVTVLVRVSAWAGVDGT